MKICIYCKKSENETAFSNKKGEHVISECLGSFPLYFGGEVVCKICNSEFSKLESVFKEDSIEGMHSAIWGIRDTYTIRMRKDRLNWTVTSQDGELGIFAEDFLFASPKEQKLYPKRIIILSLKQKKDNNMIYILFVEKFAELAKKNNQEFRKRKEWIKSLGELNIKLFGDKDWPIERMRYVLKQYDTKYNERSREYFGDKVRGQQWRVDYNMKVDDILFRVPAKIAFNYFAYCAIKQNMDDILFKPEFDKIRNYVRFGLHCGTQRPISIVNKSILCDEKNSNKKRIGHILTFHKKGNYIVSEVTLFNFFTYRIILGQYPFKIQSYRDTNFGCATFFDPFSGYISNKLYGSPHVIVGKPDYGLFCR